MYIILRLIKSMQVILEQVIELMLKRTQKLMQMKPNLMLIIMLCNQPSVSKNHNLDFRLLKALLILLYI